jgi:Holliday junction resolvase
MKYIRVSSKRSSQSKATKKKIGEGKKFEREMINSLSMISHSYVDRHPGRAITIRRRPRFVPSTIDLLFVSKKICISIECKCTSANVVYLSSVLRKEQREELQKFNRKGKFFKGIVVVKFVKHNKVVIVTDLMLKKVTPDMPGIKSEHGIWPIEDFIRSL